MSPPIWTKGRVPKKPPSQVYQRKGEAVTAASNQPGKIIATGWGGYYLIDQPNPTRPTPPRGGLFEAFQRQGEKK